MAYLNVGNGKRFILNFIESKMGEKGVALKEFDDIYRMNDRVQNSRQEWDNFQINSRRSFGENWLEQDELRLANEVYKSNVDSNELDCISMTDALSRKTRHRQRLEFIPPLISDEEYELNSGNVEQKYQELLVRIRSDALEEAKEKIIFNQMVLDFNDRYSVPTFHQYFLTDEQRKKVDQELKELESLQSVIESGDFSEKHDKSDIFSLCYDSAITSFKTIYVSNYEKENQSVLDSTERKM